ncbi:MAG: type VI secretion system accessory protein TagJ [Pyrinomonadaceae bacterium]
MSEATKRVNEAKALLDAGDLNGAIEIALHTVKSSPTDITARTFLFELSCFAGNWERAGKQLDVIGQQSVDAMVGAQIYKQNLKAEQDRLLYFSEGVMPECLLTPPKYVEKLLVVSNYIRNDKLSEARQVLDEAENERPAFSGKLNGEEFSDFRDCNDLTSSVFEAIVKGSYTWLPFEQVQRIKVLETKTLRDFYWMQAEVEMVNGTKGEMFLPSLYVNSWKSEDDQIRLGRLADWRDIGEDIYVGEGLRIFQTQSGYKPLSEIEEIEFHHPQSEESEENEEKEATEE